MVYLATFTFIFLEPHSSFNTSVLVKFAIRPHWLLVSTHVSITHTRCIFLNWIGNKLFVVEEIQPFSLAKSCL